MATSSVLIRIDDNLKQQAFRVFEEYGMTATQAVKMFFAQVAKTHSIPLSLNYQAAEPNEETQQAMLEARENRKSGNLKGYNSVQEMYNDLKKEFAND